MTDTDTPTVEIPDDVKDNSETVTDYAFMRHRAPGHGRTSTVDRNSMIMHADRFDYTRYQWYDVNPDGQRCRFDMITRPDGTVTHLFHTEYYTRVTCGDCRSFLAQSYADRYQVVVTPAGSSEAVPRCSEHSHTFRRSVFGIPGVRVIDSEYLRIGQHD